MTDIPTGKVPILESVGVAFSYLSENWARWIPAAAVYAVSYVWAQHSPGAQGLLLSLVAMLASVLFYCGVSKHFLRNEFTAPLGYGFGADELRVIGVQLALGAFAVIALFFIVVFFSVLVGVALGASGVDMGSEEAVAAYFLQSGTGLVIFVFILMMIAAFVFFAVRMSLIIPATVGERRMMIFSTWGWTKDNFWRVLACYALISFILFGLYLVLAIILMVTGMFSGLSVDESGVLSSTPAVMIVLMLAMTVASLVGGVMGGALMSHLYLGLRPDQEVSKTFE